MYTGVHRFLTLELLVNPPSSGTLAFSLSAVGPQAPHTSMPGKARVFALASLGKTLSGIVPILLWILLLDSIQDATARPNFDRSIEFRGCSVLLPPHSDTPPLHVPGMLAQQPCALHSCNIS